MAMEKSGMGLNLFWPVYFPDNLKKYNKNASIKIQFVPYGSILG